MPFIQMERSELEQKKAFAELHTQLKAGFAAVTCETPTLEGHPELSAKLVSFTVLSLLALCEFKLSPKSIDKPRGFFYKLRQCQSSIILQYETETKTVQDIMSHFGTKATRDFQKVACEKMDLEVIEPSPQESSSSYIPDDFAAIHSA